MAIFRFYQLNMNITKVLGEERAKDIFPEYSNIPNKMEEKEQATLCKTLMDRFDKKLSIEEIKKIRHMCSCNIPKKDIEIIKEIKTRTNDIDEILNEYSKHYPLTKENNVIEVKFNQKRCNCGLFRKLSQYEKISKSWCECCNGHVIKTLRYITDKEISSELIESIASGGTKCFFKARILS